MDQRFKLLLDFWQGFSYSLNIMTLMLSVDNTLSTNWWTVAREAVVAYHFLWMILTRRTTWYHRWSKVRWAAILRPSRCSHIDLLVYLIVDMKWRRYSSLVISTSVWNLALNVHVSFTVVHIHVAKVATLITLENLTAMICLRGHWSSLRCFVSLALWCNSCQVSISCRWVLVDKISWVLKLWVNPCNIWWWLVESW